MYLALDLSPYLKVRMKAPPLQGLASLCLLLPPLKKKIISLLREGSCAQAREGQDSPLGWKQLSCFALELSCNEPAFCG